MRVPVWAVVAAFIVILSPAVYLVGRKLLQRWQKFQDGADPPGDDGPTMAEMLAAGQNNPERFPIVANAAEPPPQAAIGALWAAADEVLKHVRNEVIAEAKGLGLAMQDTSRAFASDVEKALGRYGQAQAAVAADRATMDSWRKTDIADKTAMEAVLKDLVERMEEVEARLADLAKDLSSSSAEGPSLPDKGSPRWLAIVARALNDEQRNVVRLLQGTLESLDRSFPKYHAALEVLTMQLGFVVVGALSHLGQPNRTEFARAVDEWMLQRFAEYALIVPQIGQGFDRDLHQFENGREPDVREVISVKSIGCWGLRERKPGGRVLYRAIVNTEPSSARG